MTLDRRGQSVRPTGVPLLPPPAAMARCNCRCRCARLVWHFDTGRCGECDTKTRPGGKVASTETHGPVLPDVADPFDDWWREMRTARGLVV